MGELNRSSLPCTTRSALSSLISSHLTLDSAHLVKVQKSHGRYSWSNVLPLMCCFCHLQNMAPWVLLSNRGSTHIREMLHVDSATWTPASGRPWGCFVRGQGNKGGGSQHSPFTAQIWKENDPWGWFGSTVKCHILFRRYKYDYMEGAGGDRGDPAYFLLVSSLISWGHDSVSSKPSIQCIKTKHLGISEW